MAWSDEPWILEGAAVRISIVGFDDGSESQRVLDGKPVPVINADLTFGVDLSLARRLPENRGICFMGDTKKAPFDIPDALAQEMLALPVNPNGRPNSDVLRRWAIGLDITDRPQGLWIIDFGVDMPLEQAMLYEAPFEYVKEHVYPLRVGHREARQAKYWWLHARPAPDMRSAIEPLNRYLATSSVSKHRVFAWLAGDVLPSHLLAVFARDDDYFFGVMQSRVHVIWSLRLGTSLEDRPRYTPTTCFETFPFPHPTEEQREEIAEAARELDRLRQNWLNPEGASEAELKKRTLTNLYNEHPTWLANTHATLDRAVWASYGWEEDPAATDDDTILARLLALNLERAGRQGAADSCPSN